MIIAIRKESNGSMYLDKNIYSDDRFTEETLSQPPYNYTKVEVEEQYADCIGADFNDDLTFSVEKYELRKNVVKYEEELQQLTNWFKTNYTEYEQMLVRRKTLDIADTIVDEFRNKTYHNLIELYEEAEVVAGEIRKLRKLLQI